MASSAKIAKVLAEAVAPGLPLAFEAYDGSRAGPSSSVCTVRVRDPRTLNYVATAPSDLGLARAYVAGYLDVEGDLFTAMVMLARDHVGSLTWGERMRVLRGLGLW